MGSCIATCSQLRCLSVIARGCLFCLLSQAESILIFNFHLQLVLHVAYLETLRKLHEWSENQGINYTSCSHSHLEVASMYVLRYPQNRKSPSRGHHCCERAEQFENGAVNSMVYPVQLRKETCLHQD